MPCGAAAMAAAAGRWQVLRGGRRRGWEDRILAAGHGMGMVWARAHALARAVYCQDAVALFCSDGEEGWGCGVGRRGASDGAGRWARNQSVGSCCRVVAPLWCVAQRPSLLAGTVRPHGALPGIAHTFVACSGSGCVTVFVLEARGAEREGGTCRQPGPSSTQPLTRGAERRSWRQIRSRGVGQYVGRAAVWCGVWRGVVVVCGVCGGGGGGGSSIGRLRARTCHAAVRDVFVWWTAPSGVEEGGGH